jgi:tRNA(Arg) A34 adenosine deaminase TadA
MYIDITIIEKTMNSHEKYMKMASDLASISVNRGSGPFGAIIIDNETKEIIGRGHNMVVLENDPTLHAEMVAIKHACRFLNTFKLENCTLYTSCEPCPMCLSACYWAHIPTIYYGNTKDDAKRIQFDDSFIYDEIQLPVENRKIKMIHLDSCSQYYSQAFNEWSNKNDKIQY